MKVLNQIIAILLVICFFPGCNLFTPENDIINDLSYSETYSEAPVAVKCNDKGKVSIKSENLNIEYNIQIKTDGTSLPDRYVIQYLEKNDSSFIHGFDPDGEYESFTISGSPEELKEHFGNSESRIIPIVAGEIIFLVLSITTLTTATLSFIKQASIIENYYIDTYHDYYNGGVVFKSTFQEFASNVIVPRYEGTKNLVDIGMTFISFGEFQLAQKVVSLVVFDFARSQFEDAVLSIATACAEQAAVAYGISVDEAIGKDLYFVLDFDEDDNGFGKMYASYQVYDYDPTDFNSFPSGILIGKSGPSGGLIFYDDKEDGIDDIPGYRYLEAAPFGWYNGGDDPTKNWYEASIECNRLSLDNFNTWYLPSKNELNLMYQNLHEIELGQFNDSWYWSSTEGTNSGWGQNFLNGMQIDDVNDTRYNPNKLRPIRAFGLDGNAIPKNTILFNSNEGSNVSAQLIQNDMLINEPIRPTKPGFTFAGWYLDCGLTIPWEFESYTVMSNMTLYAKWIEIDNPNYNIGDAGPAGGYIFYVDTDNEFEDWDYLEAAPFGWYDTDGDGKFGEDSDPLFIWGVPGRDVSNSNDFYEIGEGLKNTVDIVNVHKTLNCDTYAAEICLDVTIGNYDDWFLPSGFELDEMYTNLKVNDLGEFSTMGYWSSSERPYSSFYAYGVNFSNGQEIGDYTDGKSQEYCVRPIRKF